MEKREALFRTVASFLRERGAVSVKVFGSYAKGEETPESDIDVLVEFGEAPGLLEFIRMEREISEMTGIKVDLVTRKALKPYIGQRILREAVSI